MKGIILITALLFLFSGCSSATGPDANTAGNPAAPPSPPAEVPSALRFPESIDINIDKLRAGEVAGLQASLSVGDDVGAEVLRLQDGVKSISSELNLILAPLHQLIIPVGTEVRNFEDLLFVKNRLIGVQIDFADFDYDGDGVNEGCSGHTAGLPICFRIWTDTARAFAGFRTIAGFFDAFPTEDNPGAGRFKGLPIVNAENLVGAIYDHRDPTNKFTDSFFSGLKGSEEIPELGENSHARLDQVGPEESAEKTINFSHRNSDGSDFEQKVGRFREDENLLSLTSFTGDPALDSTAACIDITPFTEHLVVETDLCVEAGIDVERIPFVDFLDLSDVNFPDDFPERPTF